MYLKRLAILLLLAAASFDAGSFAQTISPAGIVNAAGLKAPVAPGSVIAIIGSNLAAARMAASGLPLPTTLGGVSVVVNGYLAAPLFSVSPGQITAQLPYETAVGSAAVTVNGSAPVSFLVTPSAPGILVYGTNRAVAINEDYALNGPEHPALAGGWVTAYMTGQGTVDPPVVSGASAPSDSLAVPALPVTASIGGQPADVVSEGLTPGMVGVFQVSLRVPPLASGDFPLIVTVGEAQSSPALLSVASTGRVVPSIVRTIAYHQLTSLPDKGPDYRTSTAISGNGAVIAFTRDSGPNQIYIMNFDGTGQRMIDSYKALCYCGSIVDISDDGSKVVSTEGRQIRLVNQGAALPLVTIDPSSAGSVSGLRMQGDGRRVFFLVDRDAAIAGSPKSIPIQRGLYVINADGSGMRQIVGPNAVAALFGGTASNYYTPEFKDTGNAANRTLGVTTDGSRIAFGARKVGGSGPDAIFGVNLDGSGLHIVLGPVRYVGHLGISANGSKVLYDATLSGFTVETGVVNFDGTGQLALRHDGIGEAPGVQLSADGSLLLAYDILYKTDGSGSLQLSTLLNALTPGRPVMNSTATRFVYSFVPPGTYSLGLSQLVSAEINPATLGAAPTIVNPSVNPVYAVAGGSTPSTVTAAVSSTDRVIGVNYALLLDGLVEDPVNGNIFLLDDGRSGDQAAGDGIFTCNNVIAQAKAPTGPRLLRLFAQVMDASGMRHGTLVDVTPFSVVLTPTTASLEFPHNSLSGSQPETASWLMRVKSNTLRY